MGDDGAIAAGPRGARFAKFRVDPYKAGPIGRHQDCLAPACYDAVVRTKGVKRDKQSRNESGSPYASDSGGDCDVCRRRGRRRRSTCCSGSAHLAAGGREHAGAAGRPHAAFRSRGRDRDDRHGPGWDHHPRRAGRADPHISRRSDLPARSSTARAHQRGRRRRARDPHRTLKQRAADSACGGSIRRRRGG